MIMVLTMAESINNGIINENNDIIIKANINVNEEKWKPMTSMAVKCNVVLLLAKILTNRQNSVTKWQ